MAEGTLTGRAYLHDHAAIPGTYLAGLDDGTAAALVAAGLLDLYEPDHD